MLVSHKAAPSTPWHARWRAAAERRGVPTCVRPLRLPQVIRLGSGGAQPCCARAKSGLARNCKMAPLRLRWSTPARADRSWRERVGEERACLLSESRARLTAANRTMRPRHCTGTLPAYCRATLARQSLSAAGAGLRQPRASERASDAELLTLAALRCAELRRAVVVQVPQHCSGTWTTTRVCLDGLRPPAAAALALQWPRRASRWSCLHVRVVHLRQRDCVGLGPTR
mgnify:CR=1 FL=1